MRVGMKGGEMNGKEMRGRLGTQALHSLLNARLAGREMLPGPR